MGNCDENSGNCNNNSSNPFGEVLEYKRDKKERFDEKYRRSTFKCTNLVHSTTDFRFGRIEIVKSFSGSLLMKKRFLYKKARKFELSAASKMIRMKFDPKHFIRYDVIKTNNLNILGSMTLTVVH